jgi:hypothetical protein
MKVVFKAGFFLFIFFLISCKKDKKDTQPPVITFNAPATGQTFNYILDSASQTYHIPINVNAHVLDNEHLSSVYVVLTDINHTPVQGSDMIAIPSVNFILNITYDVTQFRLQTGTYIMQITADDGYNSTTSFQPVNIIASPTIWLGYCINSKSSPQNIVMYDTLTGGAMSQKLSIPIIGAYSGMKYGGYYGQLYINGNATQPFTAFDLQNNVPAYTQGLTGSQINYTCLYTDGSKAYVGYDNGNSNGNIYSYLNTGTQSTSYRLNPGGNLAYPYYFTTTTVNNVAVFKNVSASGSDNLVTFSTYGAEYNNALLPAGIAKVIAILEMQNDSLYVLGNDANNQAAAYIYTFSGGFSASPLGGFGSLGKMLSAAKINGEFMIFSTTTGVYACKEWSLNTVSILPNSAQKVEYQAGLNVLTVASGSNLNAYSVGTTTVGTTSYAPIPKLSFILSDSIVDFEVITNK